MTSAGTTIAAPACSGITSLPPSAASAPGLLTIVRTAWSIEHGLHYQRDVTLRDDACQV